MQFKKGRQNYIYSQLDPKNGALLLELSSVHSLMVSSTMCWHKLHSFFCADMMGGGIVLHVCFIAVYVFSGASKKQKLKGLVVITYKNRKL